MEKNTLIAVGIASCIVVLGGLWLWNGNASVQPQPTMPKNSMTFDPVPIYVDDEMDESYKPYEQGAPYGQGETDPHSDSSEVTRIIIKGNLTGSDINQALSDKVIIGDQVVNQPQGEERRPAEEGR